MTALPRPTGPGVAPSLWAVVRKLFDRVDGSVEHRRRARHRSGAGIEEGQLMKTMRVGRRTAVGTLGLFVLAVATVLLGIGRASAEDRGPGEATGRGHRAPFDYTAMWQNIDPLDGEPSLISITPGTDRGTFDVLLKADFFTICDTEDGQGYARGSAEIVDGALLSEDWVIVCEGAPTISVPARFEPDRANDLLTMTLVGVDRPAFVSHRISSDHSGR